LKTKHITIVALFVLLFISACEKKPAEPEKSLNVKLNFNFSEYSEIFKNQFVPIDEYIIQNDSLITYYDTLKYFYSLRDYQPLFIKSFDDNDNILISILEGAGEHGLNPQQYHFSDIINDFAGATDTVPNLSRYYLLAMTELLVSDAILKYSYHLRYGVVNPRELFPDSYFLPYDDSSKGNLLEPLRQENLVQYFNDIQPKSKRYRDLQEALKYYSRFEDLNWTLIPLPVSKIEVGTRDASLPEITEKLIALEYLDTSKNKISDPLLYDSLIAGAVKSFQRANGLNDDGVIGKNTIEILNTTPQQYIEKIKINLDRFRWNNYTDSTKYILVNIPDFMLYIFENGEEVFKSKVCTGGKRPKYYENQMKVFKKTKRWSDKPDDWETPNLYGQISYMVLNPTWNVPQSIMREEIVYKMKKDSSYLSSHNFKVYLDTLELNPDSIKISDLSVELVTHWEKSNSFLIILMEFIYMIHPTDLHLNMTIGQSVMAAYVLKIQCHLQNFFCEIIPNGTLISLK